MKPNTECFCDFVPGLVSYSKEGLKRVVLSSCTSGKYGVRPISVEIFRKSGPMEVNLQTSCLKVSQVIEQSGERCRLAFYRTIRLLLKTVFVQRRSESVKSGARVFIMLTMVTAQKGFIPGGFLLQTTGKKSEIRVEKKKR